MASGTLPIVLLDIGGVALAIGLAVVGFAVVVLVSVLVLRLLGVVLGDGDSAGDPLEAGETPADGAPDATASEVSSPHPEAQDPEPS